MTYLRSLCLAFSFAMIGGGILRLVSPQGNMERTMRMVTGLFIICCIIIPFSQLNSFASSYQIDELIHKMTFIDSSTVVSENNEDEFLSFVQKDTEKRVAEDITALLQEKSIEVVRVAVALSGYDDDWNQAEVTVFVRLDDLVHKDDIFLSIQSKYPQNTSVVVKLEEENETSA